MAGEGAVAVVVTCPFCSGRDAVATMRFDRGDQPPGLPHLESVSCPNGCDVDVNDPDTLRRIGLST